MRLQSSVDRLGAAVAARLSDWPAYRYSLSVRISLWLSVVVVAGLFGWGAWQRRWMADDGLIVLRTVRNLLAGNGPVFNAGERVESNTSTLWTYLITAASWVAGPLRLEYVTLALTLGLSVAGVVLVMLGAARLYAPGLQGRRALLLPAGALVYIAIPPARDFASSGLENGLVLAYVGLLWWLMVCWSQAPFTGRTGPGRYFTAALAFVAGLSVLVRPELALVGGLALLMMVLAAQSWRRRLLIVAAGGALPVAYQIFRMGYYGLLVPQTAIAKDASGAKWAQGFTYLGNFNAPYLLWIPALALVVLAVMLSMSRSRRWRASGGLSDLPDGLLRAAGAPDGDRQGRLGCQVVAGVHLSEQFQRALSAVDSGRDDGDPGRTAGGLTEPAEYPGTKAELAPRSSESDRGSRFHRAQRSDPGRLLGAPGR